ncbi:MAG TPA: hypothetical protein VI007_01955 [bacterium]
MARPSGSEIRRLIELREMIKVESLRLPTVQQRHLLALLEAARPWKTDPPRLPEMSRGELVRAIRWRLGTIPLQGVLDAARFIERAHRRRR